MPLPILIGKWYLDIGVPHLPVYVCGVGQYGQGGRDIDGDDHPGSGEDLVVVGGGGGQSGDSHTPVPTKIIYFVEIC